MKVIPSENPQYLTDHNPEIFRLISQKKATWTEYLQVKKRGIGGNWPVRSENSESPVGQRDRNGRRHSFHA